MSKHVHLVMYDSKQAELFQQFERSRYLCRCIACTEADPRPVWQRFMDDAVVAPWYHQPCTFNTETFELQLPSFTIVHESTPIELRDGQRIHLSQTAVGPQAYWLAELHLFYLTFPELCRKCLCSAAASCTHPDYAGLWKQFRQETAAGEAEKPAKADIPAALLAWHKWAQQNQTEQLLDRHQVEVCYGPQHALTAYDRVIYGSVEIVATVQEGSKHARDSVVMLYDDGMLRAGRVTRFLVHTAPGCLPDLEHDTNIADLRLYATVPRTHQATKASSEAVGCPIFKSNLVDAPQGNLWPILKLAPAKFWIVPHHSGNNHVMALHRFASFRDLVPGANEN